MSHIPVLIVGAGPTGLTMANELYRNSVDFRIIDKKDKPVSTSNALAVQARTLQIWAEMGIIDEALSRGVAIRGMNVFLDKTHIPIRFDLIDSAYPYILGLAQHETETILMNHLKSQNINVEMDVELTDIYQSNNRVLATLVGKNGHKEDVEADWVIACDGAHSLIRKKLNMPFEGEELTQHFFMADCNISGELVDDESYAFLTPKGPLLIVPFSNDLKRVIIEVTDNPEFHDVKTPTKQQIKDLAAERCPKEVKFKNIPWTSAFYIHARIVPKFRSGRVFFAGDSAHLHSPAGGQGMNTGIQDAYNLAWKLAAIIHKNENPMVLDTYHEERYKVASDIIKNTSATTNFATVHQPLVRGIRNFILKSIMRSKFVQKKVLQSVSELSTNYRNCTLSYDAMSHLRGPKAGDLALDSVISTNSSDKLFDHLQGTKFSLLVFLSDNEDTLANKDAQQTLLDLKDKYADEINFICVASKHDTLTWEDTRLMDTLFLLHMKYHVRKPSLYLIRPDKYIAYRSLVRDIDSLVEYCNKVFTR